MRGNAGHFECCFCIGMADQHPVSSVSRHELICNKETTMTDWDAVVIGSGIGGLGAAVALSNLGQKVLVLEQHYLPGGWCHTFALEGHKFSPGVHYIGQLQEGGRMRTLLEGLGVGGDIEFMELNPDGFDHIVFRDETFDIPCGEESFQQRLIERFPDEHKGIRRYFRLMKKVDAGLQLAMSNKLRGIRGKLRLLVQAPSFVFSGLKPLSQVIDRYIRDPKLKAILESRAGDHGLSPDQVPFLQHVAIDCHYWNGAWFPKGGGGAIPRFHQAAQREWRGNPDANHSRTHSDRR